MHLNDRFMKPNTTLLCRKPKQQQKSRLTIRRVARQSTEYDQHVVDVQLLHDLVRLLLGRCHRLADARNVRIVPGVVVHQYRTVGHCRDLVAIIPPGHYTCILWWRSRTREERKRDIFRRRYLRQTNSITPKAGYPKVRSAIKVPTIIVRSVCVSTGLTYVNQLSS